MPQCDPFPSTPSKTSAPCAIYVRKMKDEMLNMLNILKNRANFLGDLFLPLLNCYLLFRSFFANDWERVIVKEEIQLFIYSFLIRKIL